MDKRYVYTNSMFNPKSRSIVLCVLCKKSLNNALPLPNPFVTIGGRIVEILVRCNTKNSTAIQLLRQRNDVKVKETDLPIVPVDTWIHTSSTSLEGPVAFHEEL